MGGGVRRATTEGDDIGSSEGMSPTAPVHVPVMADETLTFLNPSPGCSVVDATVGAGGHALIIIEAMRGQGTLVCLDRDAEMMVLAKQRFRERGVPPESVHWLVGSFGDLAEHLGSIGIQTFDGVLFDLGLNSAQIANPERGFSFDAQGPLDARFSRDERIPTLGAWLQRVDPLHLEKVLREYGGERYARRIARAIVRRRERQPIATTTELAALVRAVVPRARGYRRLDSATRTFQALRMAVNAEPEHLARGLEQAIAGLAPGGRIVVLSFHSGEDRLVKEAFRRHDQRRQGWGGAEQATDRPLLNVLTPKPIRPGESECRDNPRARSARLRAAEKIAQQRPPQ